MKKTVKLLIGLLFIIHPALFAQDAPMADAMRSEGKIYVVVAIMLVIFLGLIAYLFYTDRKISNLEKRLGK
ncbi:MAG TPA: CcmD family protein [Cyclobacteriaceae bacterium]|nr:CcmD family protein [Cyclobacteriaceae bacterium]